MTVPDEAVEAAVEILSAYIDVTPDLARELARSQLEAAAPFIAAQAWDEGARAMFVDDPFKPTPTNPYRSGT